MRNSILILLFTLFSCQKKSDVRVLKLAHGLDPSHSVHIAMVHLAEKVEEFSEGKMRIEIYPSQQLGAERELLELLQIGAIDITKTSAAVMENFSPLMQILSLPYLFRDSTHERNVLEGEIGKKILESGVPYYLRGLCYYDAGRRSFYTKEKPVNKPDDLEGLKIRVQASNTAIKLVQTFGGAATPIAFGELYTALQQGVVDGAENNPPSFYLTRHYEVCKYYSLNEHTAVPDVLLISEHTWQDLNDRERDWIIEAVQESAAYQRVLWQRSEQEALEAVVKAGVQIVRPDKSVFRDKVSKLGPELLDDPKVLEVFYQIQNAQ